MYSSSNDFSEQVIDLLRFKFALIYYNGNAMYECQTFCIQLK